jgi:predicted metal-binding protein
MITRIEPRLILFNKKIQHLCKVPYYNHKKECPNYGKKDRCPPNQLLIDKVLDFNKNVYVIYTKFCVGEFAERMRQKHPEWANHPRQWYNPRRWQPRARKIQRNEEEKAILEYGIESIESIKKIVNSPEAHGVDVSNLMKHIGIKLKWGWPPKHILTRRKYFENFVYRVSLGGANFISK